MQEVQALGQQVGEVFWYEIEGQTFYQQTLVLGQSARLAPFFDGLTWGGLDAEATVAGLGAKLGAMLEIVLIPKGCTAREHVEHLEAPGKLETARLCMTALTHVDVLGIIDDFFACNLDTSLLLRATAMLQGIQGPTVTPDRLTPSNGSAPLPPEATPQVASMSSV